MDEAMPDNGESNEDVRIARWEREMDAWHREHGPQREERTLWLSNIWRVMRELLIHHWR
jgi:hypothetical protein